MDDRFRIEGRLYLTERGEKGGRERFVAKQRWTKASVLCSCTWSPSPNRPKLQLTLV
ncbi:hypothetical protein BT93_E1753 [Corymbia citriodora subsp. variegata]|nr:hypothetical protein BT93_E1753 [Corymbia citriodora subsp. variegata]KAF8029181.1 hypothetical protein BT93_E1753 [Corymbia citriodora subsp. variegata]